MNKKTKGKKRGNVAYRRKILLSKTMYIRLYKKHIYDDEGNDPKRSRNKMRSKVKLKSRLH